MPELQTPTFVRTIVRAPTEEDLPWILEQLAAFDRFAGYKRPLLEDLEQARAGVLNLMRAHYFMLAYGLSEDLRETPLGFIAGWRTGHPFNPNIRVLTETFWWVAPEHRRSSAGLRLLDAFVKYGRSEFDLVVMVLEKNSPVSDRHLLRRGFRRGEISYCLEV